MLNVAILETNTVYRHCCVNDTNASHNQAYSMAFVSTKVSHNAALIALALHSLLVTFMHFAAASHCLNPLGVQYGVLHS